MYNIEFNKFILDSIGYEATTKKKVVLFKEHIIL